MTVQELKEKAENTASVAYHKFVLLHKEYKTDLFCFFEGNSDSDYYYPRIKEYSKSNHHPITCGNKKAVLKTYILIKENYNLAKTSFFIDNDFDKRIDNDDIYETPCYSIENFYTSRNVIIDILKNEFKLSELDESFNLSIKIFDENQKVYHEKSIYFNAWYAVIKEKSNGSCVKTNVCLCNSIPKELVLLKIGEISGDYDLLKIRKHFPESIAVNEKDILNKIDNFKHKSLNKVLRGKFELEFIHAYFQHLIDDANTKSKRTILKTKTKFRIDKAQMLSQLSQYAETPDCLKNYLTKFN